MKQIYWNRLVGIAKSQGLAGIAIALVGGLLMTYFHLSLLWTIIYVLIIIIATVIVLLLPRISNKIGLRSPFYHKTMVSKTELKSAIQIPYVSVCDQDDLPSWSELFNNTEREIMIQGHC